MNINSLYNNQLTGVQKGVQIIYEIASKDIVSIPFEVETGKDFSHIQMVTVMLRDGSRYDILFDNLGEPLAAHRNLKKLCQYFNKSFYLGKLDNQDCLINKL